jgi:hypothetical protein
MAKKEEEETLPAVLDKVPGHLATIPDYGEDAGDGFEGMSPQEMAPPFLALSQPMTPAVVEEKMKGGVWFNTLDGRVYDRERGVLFVPATTRRYFAKWLPRIAKEGEAQKAQKGGFRGHLMPDDPIVEKCIREQEFGKYEIYEGDTRLVLRDTRYVFGSVVDEESMSFDSYAVIAFDRTKISAYKKWMQRLGQFSGRIPVYGHLTRITSKQEKNDKGIYYIPIITSADPRGLRESLLPVSSELYQASKVLKQMLAKGLEQKVKFEHQAASGDDDVDVERDGHPFGSAGH